MKISYIEAIRQAVVEKMKEDQRIILMGQDVRWWGGASGVFKKFYQKFDSRVIDTPISEAATTGMAIGAAMCGIKPIVEFTFMDFILHAMDPLINQAAKIRYLSANQFRVPLVIRTIINSGRGYGATHSQNLESLFVQIPGLRVVYPSNPNDASGLMRAAIEGGNPVIFIEHKLLHSLKDDVSNRRIKIGEAEIKKVGDKLTIVTYGRMVHLALEIANSVNSGIEVLDLRSLQPLDMNLIKSSVKKTGKVIVLEEGHGFIGAEISARISEELFDYLKVPVKRIFSKRVPIPFSKELEKSVLPSRELLTKEVNSLL